jgi:hypothetical protein
MDPRTLALWNRPDTFRLFALAEGLSFDEGGNARSGRLYHLGTDGRWPCWIPWAIGECLHWHPFRVALLSTRRAGLHLVSEWRQGDGERRYGANHPVRGQGVLVITPCNVLRAAETLDEALSSPAEEAHLDAVLCARFGLPRTARSQVDMLGRLDRLERAPTGPGHARDRHPLAA